MVSRLYIPILFIFVLFGCSKEYTAPTEYQSTDKISDAEYTVLRTIIDSLYYFLTDSQLVLRDSTTSGLDSDNLDSALTDILQHVQGHINALKVETMENFKFKNLTNTYIQSPVRVHPACVLSSQAHYPFPSIEVSRVGFSPDGKQAVAYIGCVSAPLVGSGCYHVLSQEQGKWIIIGIVMIWIS